MIKLILVLVAALGLGSVGCAFHTKGGPHGSLKFKPARKTPGATHVRPEHQTHRAYGPKPKPRAAPQPRSFPR